MTESPLPEPAVPTWTLGDRLRKAREHAGLKQAELAEEIGVGRTSIVNYESGSTTPSRPVLLSWALRPQRVTPRSTGPKRVRPWKPYPRRGD